MKKQVLFICSNMGIGGFQKSLISLLHCFDYEKYDVDLLLLNPHGVFMDIIPPNVNVLKPVIEPEYFESSSKAIRKLLNYKKYVLAVKRVISAGVFLVNKGWGAIILSKAVPALSKEYDVAIDYNGQHILYYMIEKIKAKKKITYFHSDYKKWPYYEKADRKYYGKVDAIVTVSDLCVQSMKDIFPEYSEKIYSIENINSEKTVNLFPLNSNDFKDNFEGTRLVTVGRVCEEKGIDLAIDSCRILKEKGYNVRWYWVGPCDNFQFYKDKVAEKNITEDFIFLGATNNPYDYMRNCHIIVHPSFFEGKAVAIEEAKVFGKPIVATNFSTVFNQIENEKTGLIVEMNSEKIADAVIKLIENNQLYNEIINNLNEYKDGNEFEINKLYALIEDE